MVCYAYQLPNAIVLNMSRYERYNGQYIVLKNLLIRYKILILAHIPLSDMKTPHSLAT